MSSKAVARDARRARPAIGALLLVVSLGAVAAVLAWRGYTFYSLGLDARVDHDDFRILGPGEVVGHGYGVVGTLLIFTNLAYVVRRRLARWPLGSMRFWLDLHVVTGLAGSVLIVFHSAFQLRTPIASVTSASLFLVVFTGIVGRYLYALSPQHDDEALSTQLEAIEALVPGSRARLQLGFDARPITHLPANASLLRTLLTLPRWLGEWRARRNVVRDELGEGPSQSEENVLFLRRAVASATSLAGAEVRIVAARTLLRTWRGLHRLLAILMLLSVSVHIGVAWFYGYRWLWSE